MSGVNTERQLKAGEIEDASHSPASYADDAVTVALAGLIGDGSQASQHADLLGSQGADLGKTGDERCATSKAKLGIEVRIA
jgi:hypothetical protein